MKRLVPSSVCAALLAASCGAEVDTFDRNAMLKDVGEDLIVPSYTALVDEAKVLESAAADFCSAPSVPALTTVLEAWAATKEAQERTEGWRFGPYRTGSIGARIDRWPTKPVDIERILDGDTALTPEFIASTGANKKGLPAIEYFITSDAGPEVVVSTFTGGAAGARRCSYLSSAATDVRVGSEAVLAAWTGGYLAEFSRAGEDSTQFASGQEAVDLLVNGMIGELEVIVKTQLGKPLGDASGGTPDRELLESWRTGRSADDVLANVESVRAAYIGAGDGSVGLSAFVTDRDPDLDARARRALDDAVAATKAMPAPLRDSVVQAPQGVRAASDAIDAAVRVLKVDVAARLGVLLTFNDADGD
ncbi:MAG: imelysin family protein [Myxococcota bacterium]